MRGRKPKPTHLKLVQGNPGKRRIKNSPEPDKKRPPCPSFMKHEARKAWKYACDQLEKMGTLGSSDQAIIAGYCTQWEIMVLATRRLHEIAAEGDRRAIATAQANGREIPPERMKSGDYGHAFITQTTNGNLIQNPLFCIANAAWEKCTRYAAMLGFSPTDRARIDIEPPQPKSLREELMS